MVENRSQFENLNNNIGDVRSDIRDTSTRAENNRRLMEDRLKREVLQNRGLSEKGFRKQGERMKREFGGLNENMNNRFNTLDGSIEEFRSENQIQYQDIRKNQDRHFNLSQEHFDFSKKRAKLSDERMAKLQSENTKREEIIRGIMDQIRSGFERNQLAIGDIKDRGKLLVKQIKGYQQDVLQIRDQIKDQDITPQLPAIQNLLNDIKRNSDPNSMKRAFEGLNGQLKMIKNKIDEPPVPPPQTPNNQLLQILPEMLDVERINNNKKRNEMVEHDIEGVLMLGPPNTEGQMLKLVDKVRNLEETLKESQESTTESLLALTNTSKN